MKSEPEIEKVFLEWFSECSNADDARYLLSIIYDVAEMECENRLFDLED